MLSTKILFIIADANNRGGTEILSFNLLHSLTDAGIPCKLLSITPYDGNDPLVLSFPKKEYQMWKRQNENPLNKILGYKLSDSILKTMIELKAQEVNAEWIINHTYDIVAAIPTHKTFHTAQIFNWSIKGYERSVEQIIKNKRSISHIFSWIGFHFTKQRWHHSLSHFNKLILLTDAACTEIAKISSSIHNKQLYVIPNPLMQTQVSKHISTLKNKNLTFVGRLSSEKGVMRLLRIWKHIYKQLPEYTLNIYGEGNAKKEMDEYINKYNIPHIVFKGFCNDLEQIYTQSDLLLMTSDTEGFGMVLIEAMYFGVPCISFDCPVSPKDIIANAGVTIPCYDEKKYTETIISLLKNDVFLRKLQQRSITRAQDYYIDKIIKKWENLILLQDK